MSNWTLTPDGLRTDEQLWAEDALDRIGQWCPQCHNEAMVPAPINIHCTHKDQCPQPAAIICDFCANGWCRDCFELGG